MYIVVSKTTISVPTQAKPSMEEKRKDTGIQLVASSALTTATNTPPKASETPASEPPSSRRRGGGQKRKSSNPSSGNTSNPSTTSSSKRQAREKLSAVPFPPIHNGPWTRARQLPNNGGVGSASDAAYWAGIVKSEGESEAVGPLESGGGGAVKMEEESSAAKEDWEALEAKIEAEYDVIRSRDVNSHVVPIPSGWFSWTKVHPLEEQALRSFFNGKSENRTPEIYLEIRNWIMNKFHANPNSQIELKDLSELSVGVLDARQEVMEFLDYWGLINYHPFPQTDSAALTSNADGASKMGSLVEKLYHFETEQSCARVVPRTNVATANVSSRLFPESAIAEESAGPEGPAYHCNSCSADCSRKRYHCQKEADFDLCTECFNSAKFGSYMSPSDFILMEPAEAGGASGGKWTDQETLLLLEALELFKENWNEIAEHVATKTKAQCILHFVQMPIEDTFWECDDEIDASLKENTDALSAIKDTSAPKVAPETTESKDGGSDDQTFSPPMEPSKPEDASEPSVSLETSENCALKALREAFEAVNPLPSSEGPLSFAEAGNPVMALAAFLVRLVERNVVTSMARRSLKSISGNASSVLAARHCFLLEDPPDEKKRSADSERDVAETVEQNGQKDENQNNGKQKGEKSDSVLDYSDSSNDHENEKNKDNVTEEKGLLVSPNGECTGKSHAAKELDAIISLEEVEPALPNESDNPDLSKEQAPSTAEESNDIMSKVELPPTSAKESGGGASVGGPPQYTEAPKDEEMVSDSLLPEKKEIEPLITSNSMVENGANTGEKEANDSKNENENPLETKNHFSIDKIKRVALTAISAAAVKAKLLANQEEDQIRQLAMLLMEKQLYKLETKLAFFTEMESVVVRVREQLERSKQRLYHERTQIITARLGISASSSRRMPPSLSTNRAAMTFTNSAPRPPMGTMTSLRPPISRPITPSTYPTSNPFVPAIVAGNSVEPSNQGKISSVEMK